MRNQKVLVFLVILILVVLGVVFYFLHQKKQPSSDISAGQVSPLSTSPQATDWKTYSNSNFSISYPSDLTVTENGNSVRFSNDSSVQVNSANYFGLVISPLLVQAADLKSWIQQNSIQELPDGSKKSIINGEIEDYTNGEITGYWYHGGKESDDKYIFIKESNVIYEFLLTGFQTGSSYKDNKNAEGILDQMIATFKTTK